MPIEIRQVRIDDAEQIVAILNPIIAAGTYTALDGPISVKDQRAFIEEFPERGIFHVAVDRAERRVVGLQDVEPFAPALRAFDHVGGIGTFVDLSRRRSGIGRLLFQHTFAAAVAKDYEKLIAYVRADNPAALQAYLAQGFRVIGTASRHARINGRYVDEVLIEKLLAE